MTIEILTPIHDLLKHQKHVRADMRQSSLLLAFDPSRPVPMSLTSDFYRIQLTPELKREGLGEKEFYRPELVQAGRMLKSRECKLCRGPMSQSALQCWKCVNRKCRNHGVLVESGPKRGVIDVHIMPNWVIDRQTVEITLQGQTHDAYGNLLTVERAFVRACLLILDRRYDDVVLAAIYRTAGIVCDSYGWKLL